jgi:hypothetical protein
MEQEKLILELWSRVQQLENDVAELKKKVGANPEAIQTADQPLQAPESISKNSAGKNHDKFFYNGRTYQKGRLVLAIVQDYANKHHGISFNDLASIFPMSIQGSFGVVRLYSEIRNRYTRPLGSGNKTEADRRFFTDPDEILHLANSEDAVVCTQWGQGNIVNFIQKAQELGYIIERRVY